MIGRSGSSSCPKVISVTLNYVKNPSLSIDATETNNRIQCRPPRLPPQHHGQPHRHLSNHHPSPLLVPHRSPPPRLPRPKRRSLPQPLRHLPMLALGSPLRLPRPRRPQSLAIPPRLHERCLPISDQIESTTETACSARRAADWDTEVVEAMEDYSSGV